MTTRTKTAALPESGVKDYWDIIVRRRWMILAFCLIATVSVGVFSALTTPLYSASTTLVLEGEASDVQNPSANNDKGMSFDIFEGYLQTQMSLILSRSVAGKVFEDLSLAKDPRYLGETHPILIAVNNAVSFLRKKVSVLVSLVIKRPAAPANPSPDPLYFFIKDIQLERVKGTRIIKISVLNPKPDMAARIANALADRYTRDNLKRRAMTFIRDQRMAELNSDYLKLQSKYDTLSNLYGPKHHDMIALKQEISALAKSIETEKAKNDLVAKAVTPETFSSPDEEKMLKDILGKIQESSVLSSSQMNNISIADPAVPPTEVAVPHTAQNVLIAFFASLVVGIFLAFFTEYLDDTIKDETDLKKIIGNENFMGTIPHDDTVCGFRRMSNVDRLMMHKPLSGSAEAYRLLRIQLHWFMKKTPGFKDFAVVSSIPDEGKSTVASNMAIALSQLNQKVLLVDADIRRGRLSHTYHPGKKKGLSQYLSDDLMLKDVVQQTEVPNLSVVAPGENAMRGSELLSSHRMQDFIHETRKNFDIIVYDTPPITIIADAAVLISQLHGAILVARNRITRTKIVPKAINLIHDTNVSLIGVVLNGTNAVDQKYYHRYYKD